METSKRTRFKLVPRLLDHIGLAMYSSVPKEISELVANSYDAMATNVWIDFQQDEEGLSEIIIKDNGQGMTTEEVENSYLALGYDRRKSVSSPKRKPIGSKGIGKWRVSESPKSWKYSLFAAAQERH